MANKLSRGQPFFLKTLRLYDHHNEPVAAILTEQVKGDFDPLHVHETSFLKYKESIYYFKRVYPDSTDPEGSRGGPDRDGAEGEDENGSL